MIDKTIELGNRPTIAQTKALEKLEKDWGTKPESSHYDGIIDCLMVCFNSKLWQSKIWIGIELDGYAHS